VTNNPATLPFATQPIMTSAPISRPVACAIAVVVRDHQVLLVSRAHPPDLGRWAFPGGKIELGESVEMAALRELQEEAGVQARADAAFTAIDVFDRDVHAQVRRHFVLVAVRCTWLAGDPVGGDDAAEARWFDIDELTTGKLDLSPHVNRVIRLAQAHARAFDEEVDSCP
jgi:mutator protein MutT